MTELRQRSQASRSFERGASGSRSSLPQTTALDDVSFRDLSDTQLALRVQALYKHLLLQRIDGAVLSLTMLRRGALMAQRPDKLRAPTQPAASAAAAAAPTATYSAGPQLHGFQPLTIPERTRTKIEQEAIEDEEAGRFSSVPKDLWIILATCAVGAVVQGWSQESIVGANLRWPKDLGIEYSTQTCVEDALGSDDSCPADQAKFAMVNAIPYLAASVLGPLLSDPIADIYGRRVALFIAAIFSLAGSIGGAYCQQWYQLLICRLLQGLGIGAKAAVIPTIESEVSPPVLRGRLLVSWQTFVATGIFLGAGANWIFQGFWRLQIGISFVPALILLTMCFIIPETPHWRVKNHDFGRAFTTLTKIRQTQLQAARDLYILFEQVRLKPDKPRQYRFFKKYPGLFTSSRNRNALFASWVVMAAQQFCGFNIFAFLSTTSFQKESVNDTKSLGYTFGFAAANAVASSLTFFFIDRIGRRRLLLGSLVLMFPFVLAAGFSYSTDNESVTAGLVIVYAVFYSVGAGVIPFMYSSEVFSLVYRETGMALACAVNFLLAGALAGTVSLVGPGDEFKLLGGFGALDAVAALFVWLFMRSPDEPTSLEDMDALFEPPFFDYPRYQLSKLKHRFFPTSPQRGEWSDRLDPLELRFSDWSNKRRKLRRSRSAENGSAQDMSETHAEPEA